MNSPFAKLYLDLQERIKTKVSEINWIEQDFGQDVYDKWRPNVAFPAVLIDFTNTDYSDIAGAHQHADVMINMRLLVAPFSQSYEDAPIEVRQDALEYYEIEQKLVEALHDWTPNEGYCQSLIRKRVTANNRSDIGLRIRELQFSTAWQEFFEE